MLRSDSSYWVYTNSLFLAKCGQPPCVSLSVPNVLPIVAAGSEFYFAKRIDNFTETAAILDAGHSGGSAVGGSWRRAVYDAMWLNNICLARGRVVQIDSVHLCNKILCLIFSSLNLFIFSANNHFLIVLFTLTTSRSTFALTSSYIFSSQNLHYISRHCK